VLRRVPTARVDVWRSNRTGEPMRLAA
jgi:hypothetical protein